MNTQKSTEPPKGPTWARAEANFAACQRIHDFVGESVRPIIDRHTNVMHAPQAANALIIRVHGWLRSLGKVNHPSDFQAVLSGSRAVFELAVSLTLLLHEEKRNLRKLFSWQESAKFKFAERTLRHKGPNSQPSADFVSKAADRIKKLRDEFWGGRHPERWTDRNLEQDSVAAERYERAGFVDYYNEQYSPVCWFVHGSSVMGLFEIPSEKFPCLTGRGFYDVAHFSLIACKAGLGLFGQWDAIAEQRFAALKRQVAADKAEVWSRYNPQTDSPVGD